MNKEKAEQRAKLQELAEKEAKENEAKGMSKPYPPLSRLAEKLLEQFDKENPE
jgi:hypothetical protein